MDKNKLSKMIIIGEEWMDILRNANKKEEDRLNQLKAKLKYMPFMGIPPRRETFKIKFSMAENNNRKKTGEQ